MKFSRSLFALAAALFVSSISTVLPAAEFKEQGQEKKGDWTVSYFTGEGKFMYSQMTKTFDRKETRLRVKLSDKELIVEAAADFNGVDTKAEFIEAKIWTDGVSPTKVRAFYFEEKDGEQWVRISMPTDEPGIEDGLANGKKLFIQLGKVKWQFDLKGTNPAYKGMVELFHSKGKK
jgi:hypothetical protein